jgi:hypothetical protein
MVVTALKIALYRAARQLHVIWHCNAISHRGITLNASYMKKQMPA